MSKATERITLNLTLEQYAAIKAATGGASVSDLGKQLFADYCQANGVEFPPGAPSGGKRLGAGRKKKSVEE